jgi:rare lipoprotein A
MMRRQSSLRGPAAARVVVLACASLALANCAQSNKLSSKVDPKYGVKASPRVVQFGEPVPKGGGAYRVGKPYVVAGRTYVPEENRRYRAEGIASWYGTDFHGRLTANGEVYDMEGISAAHPTLPMPSYARVTNLKNGRSLIVRVNDRGPYHDGRLIDLSHKASELLQFKGQGTARVRVEYVGAASLEGSDDRRLVATLSEGGRPAPPPSAVRVAAARPFVPQAETAPAAARSWPAERREPLAPARAAPMGELRPAFGARPMPAPRAEPLVQARQAVERASLPAPEPVRYAPARPHDPVAVNNGRGLY